MVYRQRGERVLLDRFDNLAFPLHVIKDILVKAAALPVNYQPSDITDTSEYIESRMPAIRSQLGDPGSALPSIESSKRRLESLLGTINRYAVAIGEIINSIELSELEPTMLRAIMSTVAYELTQLAHRFQGAPLSLDDDRLEFFFAAPSFITKVDLALDFAAAARAMLRAISRELTARGEISLKWRIALEGGDATADRRGHVDIGTSVSLSGQPMLAARAFIRLGGERKILVGPRLQRSAHTYWRNLLEDAGIDLPPELRPLYEHQDRIMALTNVPAKVPT